MADSDFTLSQLKALPKKQLQALQDQYRAMGALTAAQRDQLTLVEEAINSQEKLQAIQEQRLEAIQKEIASLKTRAKNEKNSIIRQELELQLKQAKNEEERIAINLAKEKVRNEENLTDKEKERLKRKESEEELEKRIAASRAKSAELARDIGSQWTKIGKDYAAHPFFNVKSLMRIGNAFRHPIEFFKTLGTTALGSFIDAMFGLAFSMDQARADFERTTGARFGQSADQVQKTNAALRQGFTDFTMLSEGMQESLTDTSVMLKAYGNITEESLARAMQASTKFFGETPMMAEESVRSMAAYARDIGVEPAMLVEQFGSMGPALAKFGNQGEEAFKDLARVAKVTGMEIQKILSITDKFDTFEEAAKRTGLLNAALGGNFVNAMDMMMETDPVARFEMIRDAISSTGLSFDDMSYYQKQFYANSLGLENVGDLALLMSGNFDALDDSIGKTSADYEEMAERSETIMSLQESFNALLADLVPILQPLIDEFRTWINEIKSNDAELDRIRNTMQSFADAIIYVVKNFKALVLIFFLGPTLIGPLIGLMFGLMGAVTGLGTSLLSLGTASGSSAPLMGLALKQLFGMALAILAIGAAINMAAEGVSFMILAFKDLGENGPAAAWSVVGLTVAFGLMLALLLKITAMWPLMGPGVGVILALGAASLMFGLGVGLAAEGFANFMNSMNPDSWSKIWDGVGAIAALAISVKLLAGALFMLGFPQVLAGAGALALVAGGVSALMVAYKEMTAPDVEPMVRVMGAVGGITTENLDEVELSMQNIVNSIDNMTADNADALTRTLRAASRANQVAGRVERTTQQAPAPAAAAAPQFVTVELHLDGDVVADKTVRILGQLVEDATLGTSNVIAAG